MYILHICFIVAYPLYAISLTTWWSYFEIVYPIGFFMYEIKRQIWTLVSAVANSEQRNLYTEICTVWDDDILINWLMYCGSIERVKIWNIWKGLNSLFMVQHHSTCLYETSTVHSTLQWSVGTYANISGINYNFWCILAI